MSKGTVFDLEATFLGLDGKGGVAKLPVGPDFWETIDRNPAVRGTMVSEQVSKADWPHWEMHPMGDEVVYLLEGEATLILERQSVEERVSCAPVRRLSFRPAFGIARWFLS